MTALAGLLMLTACIYEAPGDRFYRTLWTSAETAAPYGLSPSSLDNSNNVPPTPESLASGDTAFNGASGTDIASGIDDCTESGNEGTLSDRPDGIEPSGEGGSTVSDGIDNEKTSSDGPDGDKTDLGDEGTSSDGPDGIEPSGEGGSTVSDGSDNEKTSSDGTDSDKNDFAIGGLTIEFLCGNSVRASASGYAGSYGTYTFHDNTARFENLSLSSHINGSPIVIIIEEAHRTDDLLLITWHRSGSETSHSMTLRRRSSYK